MSELPENQNETVTPQTEENNNTSSEVSTPEANWAEPQTISAQEPLIFESIDDDVPPPVAPSSSSSSLPMLRSSSRGHRQKSSNTKAVVVALFVICLLAGSFVYIATYSMFNDKINTLQSQLSSTQESFNKLNSKITELQNQLQIYQFGQDNNNNDINTDTNSNTKDLAEIYQRVKTSVVMVQCLVPQYNWFGIQTGYSTQQGSGFVTSANNQQVIVTNNHVINSGTNITVTFADSSSYSATVLGADAYADLAVLKVNSMPNNVPSLTLGKSSELTVGESVIAVGSPYGLSGTLTTGIISALGRAITVNNRTIPDIIQTSTEINSGNSGGPLINLQGQVVGITTASVSNSQGLGFAIPSDTITREIETLINTGKYTQHPALGVSGRDMTLQLAQTMNIDTTYGWLIETVTDNSGLKKGDIIIRAGNTQIRNLDDLLTYLERNTLPGQTTEFTVIRDNQQQTINVQISTLNTN
jgi:S1-C subfamily serine protease